MKRWKRIAAAGGFTWFSVWAVNRDMGLGDVHPAPAKMVTFAMLVMILSLRFIKIYIDERKGR